MTELTGMTLLLIWFIMIICHKHRLERFHNWALLTRRPLSRPGPWPRNRSSKSWSSSVPSEWARACPPWAPKGDPCRLSCSGAPAWSTRARSSWTRQTHARCLCKYSKGFFILRLYFPALMHQPIKGLHLIQNTDHALSECYFYVWLSISWCSVGLRYSI